MDEVTQQNTALVEQAAAAANAMHEQADALTQVVHMFKMRGDPDTRADVNYRTLQAPRLR